MKNLDNALDSQILKLKTKAWYAKKYPAKPDWDENDKIAHKFLITTTWRWYIYNLGLIAKSKNKRKKLSRRSRW